MLFLIEYDRRHSRTVHFEAFGESFRAAAERARLEREIRVHRDGVDHEVVILEAESEEALRQTHARYFDSFEQILRRLESSTSASIVRERKD